MKRYIVLPVSAAFVIFACPESAALSAAASNKLQIIRAQFPSESREAGRGKIHLTDQQAWQIGKRIWHNESRGTIEGLTAWNEGEDFASLGIAHFIWYPVGQRGPFAETFPALMKYLQSNGVKLAGWLADSRGCPWQSRAAFMRDFNSAKMKDLRSLLAETLTFQVRFAAMRLENALSGILAATPMHDRARVRNNFYRVADQPSGFYALMDYVNFKGEGISPSERYRGKGWGLLQVLQQMHAGEPLTEFSNAACVVLATRVANSPPDRKESRWLTGWRNRCMSYAH